MFKKLKWPAALVLGVALTVLTPGSAQARDDERYERHHRRPRVTVYYGQYPAYYTYGYYDRWGYWHPYGHYDRWGRWHR